ncbi:MarR family winged helix-turn-helix transcriptional regulator [Flammeovirga agarivorans]|uniref:MarR family transcriptional regulator n=1 Tax=Flammeovirga agarivorans TaxID=2726742 RepID=A0A7X8SHJ4_9BACT|nr:MarR family transcriptional regulator [Flammeovirga agarivorans]NLR90233.1 MarR family transcriptional regulator [Flammeovirga agarivorans]
MINKEYYKAIFEIIKTGHWITDSVSQALKEDKITEPQYNVLRILKGQKGNPITVNEIQEKMVQRSSNVTRIVDKLLDKGFVNRSECPTNRRKMDITITDLGLSELDKMNKKVEAIHLPYKDNLTAEEAKTLEILIKKLKGEN